MTEAVVPNQLFVAGYSRSKVQNDTDVKDIFKKHGTIKEVAYKGAYAFVTFNTEIEAQEALKALNGSTYNGQKLKVDVVDNRKGRRAGPSDNDLCFKCSKGGHWARDCPNGGGRSRSPRRRRYSDSRSRRHKRSRRSDSRSYSSQSYSSSRSRRRNRHRRHRRSRSRSPRRNDRRRSPSPRRGKSPRSDSHSSVSNKRRASRSSSKSRK